MRKLVEHRVFRVKFDGGLVPLMLRSISGDSFDED
jgi:hypothetical protein